MVAKDVSAKANKDKNTKSIDFEKVYSVNDGFYSLVHLYRKNVRKVEKKLRELESSVTAKSGSRSTEEELASARSQRRNEKKLELAVWKDAISAVHNIRTEDAESRELITLSEVSEGLNLLKRIADISNKLEDYKKPSKEYPNVAEVKGVLGLASRLGLIDGTCSMGTIELIQYLCSTSKKFDPSAYTFKQFLKTSEKMQRLFSYEPRVVSQPVEVKEEKKVVVEEKVESPKPVEKSQPKKEKRLEKAVIIVTDVTQKKTSDEISDSLTNSTDSADKTDSQDSPVAVEAKAADVDSKKPDVGQEDDDEESGWVASTTPIKKKTSYKANAVRKFERRGFRENGFTRQKEGREPGFNGPRGGGNRDNRGTGWRGERRNDNRRDASFSANKDSQKDGDYGKAKFSDDRKKSFRPRDGYAKKSANGITSQQ